MNVPNAVRPHSDQVVATTDSVCQEHLDAEYADLCRTVFGSQTSASSASLSCLAAEQFITDSNVVASTAHLARDSNTPRSVSARR